MADTGHSARTEPAVNEEVAPVNEEIASAEVSGAKSPGPGAGSTGYDETAGISYEVQPRGFEVLGLDAPVPAEEPVAPVEPVPAERPVPPAEPTGREAPALGSKDGGPPLTRFRDLPLDQKMRVWRLRALIVIAVGVVFTIIASWEVGVTLAIIAGIADTVYRSRAVASGRAGQLGTIDRATLRAQKRTIKQLAAMERAGYLSLHRRPIPDSTEVIDHLVVGPSGVYAIDSEKWNKELAIRTRNNRQLWLGPESKKDRLQHAHWEAGQASERLTAKLGMEVVVQPALAIYGPKVPWDVAHIRDVDVFSGDRLKKYLRRRAKRKDGPRLTEQQIRKIHEAAGEVLPLEWQSAVTPVG